MKKAFTLVELLIVIALIAILSVGVLATINPVEQRNKATDATTSNDAGEVLNAYERYYTNASIYPWIATNNLITIDDAFGSVSNRIGFGLCGGGLVEDNLEQSACGSYKTAGSLISSDELKDSFLEKGYGKAIGTGIDQTSFDKLLYVYKTSSTEHNSIYVCYVPKAKSNRTSASNLQKITFGTVNGVADTPTDITPAVAADFKADGSPAASYTFKTPATSLFKCVP
ncbi:MAG TPA: type II secretion system protein [Candidatus Woesebacteria bacterium]|nr:type II secretion system protein [Candidatus Woesebacteria bacterium]HPR99867.1 type II secretion system protein [Candidatus Woesebacteria bacterium]